MRAASLYLGSLLLAAAGCEKTDPLFCKENPGATGCAQDADVIGDDMGDLDMGPDVDARLCFGSGNGSVCLTQAPTGPLVFTNPGTLDTTMGVSVSPACLATQPSDWMTAGQPDACFIVATSIKVDAELTVIGNRPLVLLASTTITINANLDAAGHGIVAGPGAPAMGTDCPAFAQDPASNTDGGGGGAGGSFMSKGGDGGSGDGTAHQPGQAGMALQVNPQLLRAGCNGQKGGSGQSAGNGGNGGVGGGAVYLVAGDGITIASGVLVNVSGGGGNGPGRQGGGGGGGTGGMLMFNAPIITATDALVMANGGGGSSGGDDSGSGNPDPGNEPTSPTSVPSGGTGSDTAGNGGDGYYDDGTPHDAGSGTNGGTSNRGGGAGGGGRGFIQSNVAITGATVSPAPFIP